MPTCKANQHSDQMFCDRCGLCWDVNDPDPPTCHTDTEIAERRNAEAAERYGIRKGVRVITPNGDVFKVTSFTAKEFGRPKLKGRKLGKYALFGKRSVNVYGDWEVLPDGEKWIDHIRRDILKK